MKKIIAFILFVFVQTNIAQIEREIVLPINEKIVFEDLSTGYIIVVTKEKNSTVKKVRLYNKKGDLILLKTFNKYYISSAFVSKETNNLIIIRQNACGDNEETTLALAYNISNGAQEWERCFKVPSAFSIAPNGEMILNNSQELEVLDSKSGQSVLLNYNFQSCEAKWLDRERLVIIEHQTSDNPHYGNWLESRYEKSNEIRDEKRALFNKLKDKTISEVEYKKELKAFSKKQSEDITKRSTKRKVSNRPKKLLPKASKFIVYNVLTNEIEVEKEIYTEAGHEFYVMSDSHSDKDIDIDKYGNIILSGWVSNNKNKSKKCIMKLNKNGEFIWSAYPKYDRSTITKLNLEGELYFDIKELTTDKMYRLDITNEKEIEKNTMINGINVQYGKELFGQTVKIYKGVVIDKKKNKIYFVGGENNEKN